MSFGSRASSAAPDSRSAPIRDGGRPPRADPAGWVDRRVRDGWLENSTSAADRLIATILAWAVPGESLRELAQHGMPDVYCMMLAREKKWMSWATESGR